MPIHIDRFAKSEDIDNKIKEINDIINICLPCRSCKYIYCDDRLFNYIDVQINNLDRCPCYKKSEKMCTDEELKNIMVNRKISEGIRCFWMMAFNISKAESTDECLEIMKNTFKEIYENIDENVDMARKELIKSGLYIKKDD